MIKFKINMKLFYVIGCKQSDSTIKLLGKNVNKKEAIEIKKQYSSKYYVHIYDSQTGKKIINNLENN